MAIETAEIMAETYEDVRLLVLKTVYTFHRKYGGEIELLQSKANESFMEAYHSFQPGSGSKFSTWVRFRVWNGLHDERRDAARRHRILKRQSPVVLDQTMSSKNLDWSEVTQDVETVLRLVFSPGTGLQKLLQTKTPIGMRMVLREYLIGLGWSVKRVKQCFQEIQGVLNND